MSVGTDLILDPDDLETSFAPGRNFANKLWNAGRFILGNLRGPGRPLAGSYPNVVRRQELALADRWIIARCEATVLEATAAYEKYRLNEAASAVYHFIWSDLADWYIEQIKPRLYGDQPGGDVARAVAARTFEVALHLLHPIMPFVTEALWLRLPGRQEGNSLMTAPWPHPDRRAADPESLAQFGLVQELVGAVRGIRAEYGVEPGKTVSFRISRRTRWIDQELGTIARLTKAGEISFGAPLDQPGGNAVLSDGTSIYVGLGELIDLTRECQRLDSEVSRLQQLIESQHQKLANQQFVSKAPPAVVERERAKLSSWETQARALREKQELLGCG